MQQTALKQKATEGEILLSKRLRELAKDKDIAHKDALVMQDLYFDISDSGINDTIRAEMRRYIYMYGNKKDMESAAHLPCHNIMPKAMYKNIYSAVDVLTKSQTKFSAKRLNHSDIVDVLHMVCEASNISVSAVLGKSRDPKYVRVKMAVTGLVYHKTTLKTIGGALGGKDHSTIIHYMRNVDTALGKDPELKEIYNQIKLKTGL